MGSFSWQWEFKALFCWSCWMGTDSVWGWVVAIHPHIDWECFCGKFSNCYHFMKSICSLNQWAACIYIFKKFGGGHIGQSAMLSFTTRLGFKDGVFNLTKPAFKGVQNMKFINNSKINDLHSSNRHPHPPMWSLQSFWWVIDLETPIGSGDRNWTPSDVSQLQKSR